MQNKRVLVTAGGSGIGRVIAETFAREGARVHLCDIVDQHIAAFADHPQISASHADVADPAAVDRLFDEVERRLEGLDVLVNNAGITGPTSPIEEVSIEDWRRTMAVNIDGQFYCARRAIPMLRRAGGGAIVNISSVAGRLGYPLRAPYVASKWAITGFTNTLAMELGPANIRVNAILPGPIDNERTQNVIIAKAKANQVSVEEMRRRWVSRISMRRMVDPEDVAELALFLCSDRGRNISGQALSVCGNTEGMN